MPCAHAGVAAGEGLIEAVCRGLLVAVAALAVLVPPATPARPDAGAAPARAVIDGADFGGAPASPDARRVADWVARTRDHMNAAFVIVDKKSARVHVFDAGARLRASSRALLGAAVGDDSVPGIGTRPIAQVRPEERTTPAGRFVAEHGRNLLGEDVVWVDYAAAVSMHRVRTTDPRERRLQRLASPALDDKRISYGCINVPVAFFERHIQPIFARGKAIVYVLPDVKPVEQVFGLQRVAALSQ